MTGIEHRQAKTCGRCQQVFFWSPGLGLCPYCDLSRNARAVGPYGAGEPCPPDCCKTGTP